MAYLDLKNVKKALAEGGADLAGSKLYVYGANTDVLRPIYSDSELSRTTSNPVLADAHGMYEHCYVIDGEYRIVVLSKHQEKLFESGNLSASVPTSLGFGHGFKSYAGLSEDDLLSYTPGVGRLRIGAGEIIRIAENNLCYEVAAAEVTDHHVETLGGLKLYALPNGDGYWDVRSFGAVGDGIVTDENASIQATIDAAHAAGGGTVIIPAGIYNVTCAIPHFLDGTQTQYGVQSIKVLDQVMIKGTGTIKLQDNAYGPGALFRVFASSSSGISNAGIEGITIDGNAVNQVPSVQANNILLHPLENVVVRGIKSLNANGSSIQLTAPIGSLGKGLSVVNNIVDGASTIGIQVTRFEGLTISGNSIRNCVDNGIDIYGNDGSTTPDSHDFSITGNTVDGALVGIFPETVRDGTVAGNAVRNCTIGMVYNRITGAPANIVYSANCVTNCATGWRGTGDANGILVSGNTFKDFDVAGVTLGGSSGNASYVNVEGNIFNPSNDTTPILTTGDGTVSFCQFHRNSVQRNYDIDNAFQMGSGTIVSCRFEEPYGATSWNADLKNIRRGILLQSGEATTISIPENSAGTVTMRGAAGGAWRSVWTGTFISNSGSVKLTETSSNFITPGNFFASVVGSSSTLEIDVTAATSGSQGRFDYSIEY